MKLKTTKSAKKRLFKTGSGKIYRRKTSAQHLVKGKSKRSLRDAGKNMAIARVDNKKIRKLIPYRNKKG